MELFKILLQKISKDGAYSIFMILGILFIGGTLYIQYSHSNDILKTKIATDKALITAIKDISIGVNEVTMDVKEIGVALNVEDDACLNNLSRDYAHDEMNNVLQSSKAKIMYDIMIIISNNNIHNKERQKVIGRNFTKNILDYYKTDKEYLQRVKHKGISLDKVWVNIDPHEAINLILDMMFSPYYEDKHELLRRDIYKGVDNKFKEYHKQSIIELDCLILNKEE
jgi:hypothetical protein